MISLEDEGTIRGAALLTVPELAALLHRDPRTVRKMLTANPPTLRTVTVAGVAHVRTADVLAMLGLDAGADAHAEIPGQLRLVAGT